ncbi:MAG: hypothetical protein ABIY37_16560 [Devosia sp.]
MNIKTLAAALALPALLAACAPEVESTIYLADVMKAAESGEAVTVPAVLRVPQSGEDECKEGLAALIEKLSALAPTNGKGQCISKDQHGQGTQLAEIETELQIVPAGSDVAEPNLFVLEVATTDEGRADLTLKMLKPIDEVIKALQAENPAQVEFDPSFFLINLTNDTDGALEIAVNHVFVDGKSSLESEGPVPLDRRGELKLQFSDVASSFVEQSNSYWFATVGPAN